jgi:CysZ protein
MNAVLGALSSAFRDLRETRVLALALLPPIAAIALCATLVWAYSDDWARLVADWIAGASWLAWIREWGLDWIFIWGSGIIAVAALIPVMLITAVVVTGIIAMPVIVPLVAGRNYPRLERRRGGTVAGSVWHALSTSFVFVALWLATLPLWLTGIGALVLPPVLSAYFNQRMFRYDALAEHASAAEYGAVVRGARARLFLLGLALAFLYAVPVFNLVVPILSALAFTHFCLGELARLRQAGADRGS